MTFCFTACGQKNCRVIDYHSINWQVIDSTTSYFVCSNSDIKLNSSNLFEIQYLGALQKEDNIVIQKEIDKEIISMFTNVRFGVFNYNDTTLSKTIRETLAYLTKNSDILIKYNLGNLTQIEPNRKLTVYFKTEIDSTTVTKWVNNIKTRPYIDSTFYLSKDAALRNWSKEDSTWQVFLAENPMPSSVDLFIKPSFYDTVFIKALKTELMKSSVVSDVVFSNFYEEHLKELNEFLSKTYLIKIKSKE